MSLTAENTSAPNFASRSNSKNLCGCLDLPPIVADDEKAVQNTKRERWDGEAIHCRNGLASSRRF
jgi:hypothetical protein